ncbi:hypothetical protein EYF80_011545 [Liparis tanakae]|uniref:Uncharacterized protein n=1 Tax=Liparis tanakae TaxID=230148 RepID=A0A4Z2IKG8_9TELE|nr:hypothetical protein EYF80_011545 [Liparis tanakae]
MASQLNCQPPFTRQIYDIRRALPLNESAASQPRFRDPSVGPPAQIHLTEQFVVRGFLYEVVDVSLDGQR